MKISSIEENPKKIEVSEIEKPNNNYILEKNFNGIDFIINHNNRSLSSQQESYIMETNENLKEVKKYINYYKNLFNDKELKRRDKIIENSMDFFRDMNKKTIKVKSSQINFLKEKINLDKKCKDKNRFYSYTKRAHSSIAFGKSVPKGNQKKFNENSKRSQQIEKNFNNKILGLTKNNTNLYKKGFKGNSKFDQYIKNYNSMYYKSIKTNNNLNYEKIKDDNDNENDNDNLNIKDNRPLKLLHKTYNTLMKHQNSILLQHIDVIKKEISELYSKSFTLIDQNSIPKKYRLSQDLIEIERDEKLMKIIQEIIDKRDLEEKQKREKIKILTEEEKQRNIYRQKIRQKFKKQILICYRKFKHKKMNINLFYKLVENRQRYDSRYVLNEKYSLKEVEIGRKFFQAIKYRDYSQVRFLLKENPFLIFYKDHFRQSALHVCAKRNLYKAIILLLSKGAEIDEQDEGGRTPLMIAAQNNNFKFVVILLYEIADPKLRNINGESAIDLTTDYDIKEILRRAKILHIFHKAFTKAKYFVECIRRGLDYLLNYSMGINFKEWISENVYAEEKQFLY